MVGLGKMVTESGERHTAAHDHPAADMMFGMASAISRNPGNEFEVSPLRLKSATKIRRRAIPEGRLCS